VIIMLKFAGTAKGWLPLTLTRAAVESTTALGAIATTSIAKARKAGRAAKAPLIAAAKVAVSNSPNVNRLGFVLGAFLGLAVPTSPCHSPRTKVVILRALA